MLSTTGPKIACAPTQGQSLLVASSEMFFCFFPALLNLSEHWLDKVTLVLSLQLPSSVLSSVFCKILNSPLPFC